MYGSAEQMNGLAERLHEPAKQVHGSPEERQGLSLF
jgi:hypothetical protein